jgi:hypothetical protein
MYRDAEDVLRRRLDAVVEEAGRQLAGLDPEDLELLPVELREELASLEHALAPGHPSAARVQEAERALETRGALLRAARRLLQEQRSLDRRRRRDKALARGTDRRTLTVAALALAAVLLVVYFVTSFHAKASCQESAGCIERGDCTANAWLTCVPASDEDCRRSLGCRGLGFCSLADGYCQLRSQADCNERVDCQPPASCRFEDGSCVVE